jgi:UDP-3-O-acyl-N-acetylglucosamine deacetylase
MTADLTLYASEMLKQPFLPAGSAVEIATSPIVGDTTVSYSREELTHMTHHQRNMNASNSRMKCTEVHNVSQYEIQSLEDSYESFDTIDIEDYSIDTSFIDQVMLKSV